MSVCRSLLLDAVDIAVPGAAYATAFLELRAGTPLHGLRTLDVWRRPPATHRPHTAAIT